jgi:hypothetical protein
MKRESITRVSIAVGLAVALAGCSGSGLLNSKSNVVPSDNVQVGNNLALPPDLSLPQPGTGPETYQAASVADDSIYGEDESAPALKPAAPGQLTRGQQASANGQQGDIYDQYGISKLKPDGTKKEEWELKAELKAAIRKRKQQQNPRYGTVFNMGNIWSDQ